jgi:hypothetical protein
VRADIALDPSDQRLEFSSSHDILIMIFSLTRKMFSKMSVRV